MSGTISTTTIVGSSYTLTVNPTTVTNTGQVLAVVGSALYGPGGTAWTVTNMGSLFSAGGGAAGIALASGGSIDNQLGGFISAAGAGHVAGVKISGGTGTVSNAGVISGYYDGVYLNAAGSVTNLAGGQIRGNNAGVRLSGAYANTVVNAGTINGPVVTVYSPGVSNSHTLINTGLIGGNNGSSLGGQSDLVTNTGTIASSNGIALNVSSGSVTNEAGGLINGLIVGQGVVVSNFGTIRHADFGVLGGYGATVFNNGLIQGGTVNGLVVGGIYLRQGGLVRNGPSGVIAGYLGVAGPLIYGFPPNPNAQPTTIDNAGTIEAAGTGADSKAISLPGGVTNLVIDRPGAVFSGTVNAGNRGQNTLELAAGTTSGIVTGLGSQFVNFGSIQFDTGADWLLSGNTQGVADGETISGFSYSDTIEITGVTEQFQSFSNGTLSLTGSENLQLLLTGSYDPAHFLVSDNGANTEIIVTCFAAGMRIATPDGATAVEALAVGDLVLTHTGAAKPIIWLGHRHIDCTQHPKPTLVWPVRVCAGAFGPRQPSADLYLSPEHCIYFNNVLIPVKHLINGLTIEQVRCPEVTYYHLELPLHDVVISEGLPVESYLDTDGRTNFANGGGVIRLFPDFASLGDDTALLWEAIGFAPRHVVGPAVDAARSLLMARAKRLAAPARRSHRKVAG